MLSKQGAIDHACLISTTVDVYVRGGPIDIQGSMIKRTTVNYCCFEIIIWYVQFDHI